jgi:hypothetical protein
MSLKLTKKKFGRRRFLSFENIQSFVDWKIELDKFIELLEKNTLYQRVGTDVYFCVTGEGKIQSLMIEVMGKPEILDQDGLGVVDIECDFCFYLPSLADQFDFTPKKLMEWAYESKTRIDTALERASQSPLCEFFFIVFNHEKLALQFFNKNDYIQKRL